MRSSTLPMTSYTSGTTRRRFMTPLSRAKAATCAAASSMSVKAQEMRNLSWGVVGAHSGQVRRKAASSRRHSWAMGLFVEFEFCSRFVMASAALGAAVARPAGKSRDLAFTQVSIFRQKPI